MSWTPTVQDVRKAFTGGGFYIKTDDWDFRSEAFDRFLDSVKAEAWDEGASAAHNRLYARIGADGLIDQHALLKFPSNPYRRTP